MKIMNANLLKRWVAPLAGILSTLAVSTSFGALIAPGTPSIPGVALGPGTSLAADPSLAGWAVGAKTVAFSEPTNLFQGILTTVVVQNTSGFLDFYFQLGNTSLPVSTPSPLGTDIFRLAVSGFTGFGTAPGDGLVVSYRTDGLAGVSGVGPWFGPGTKAPFSADRDPGIASVGGVGFDFDSSHFLALPGSPAPGNIFTGEVSRFMLIRTNAVLFQNVHSEVVSGFGTAFASGFAPAAVPEPATLLAGLILGSFVAYRDLGRGRRRRPDPKA
jgi:hypothetical protein